jgi:hypothetical protein
MSKWKPIDKDGSLRWITHACMWNNEMNINEVVGETILVG